MSSYSTVVPPLHRLSINIMSSSSQTRGGGVICHILPCSIDEDITAPVAQYFHPTPLPSQGNNDKNDVTIMAAQFRGRGLLCATDGPQEEVDGFNDAGDCVDLTNNKVQSNNDDTSANDTSSLLLSHKRPLSKLPSTMVGVVFNNRQHSVNNTTGSINKSHSNNSNKDPPMQKLTTIETFSKIYNWRHEHDETKIMRENQFGGSEKEGLNAVLGWCELSHAIHDPIPLPQKQTK